MPFDKVVYYSENSKFHSYKNREFHIVSPHYSLLDEKFTNTVELKTIPEDLKVSFNEILKYIKCRKNLNGENLQIFKSESETLTFTYLKVPMYNVEFLKGVFNKTFIIELKYKNNVYKFDSENINYLIGVYKSIIFKVKIYILYFNKGVIILENFEIQKGIYKHYKGNYYTVFGVSKHTETEEVLITYADDKGNLWNRPYAMFFEEVNGIPRFTKI